jgi:hypothetical protein
MDPILQTYNYLDEKAKQRVRDFEPREPRFNPSSIEKCARRLGYKHLGTPPEEEEGAGFLSQYGPAGDFYHDQVRLEMKEAGVEFAGLDWDFVNRTVSETDICKTTIEHNGQTLILSGRGDGRINVGGTWMYSELKSVDEGKYRWMLRAFQNDRILEYLGEKYPSYIEQVNMMMAPEMLNLPSTYLVLINRGNCQFGFCDKDYKNRKGIVIPFDADMWEKQKNKMAMIQRLADKGELPVRGRGEGSKDCKQCPYSKQCWE